ncbi:TIGR02391 family protein [Streptomyces sp. NPDC058231]|uniref:TIGR02391 family protein n=1 Tax=Streptomyces sp. NPDC058231 TaxID=3346392 RepID=UPI0036E29C85
MRNRDGLSTEEIEQLDQVRLACPDIARTCDLARVFTGLVRDRRGRLLADWIRQADHSGLIPVAKFAAFLRQDLDAVTAGLTLEWSSGIVEGHVNRVKTTQNKLGRKDLSETKLFQQAFSLDEPKPGQPRLRLMDKDGSDAFRNVHRGPSAFAEGFFAGIRNPNSHTDGLPELPEHEALEQLAALSVLARWVDTVALVTA